MRTIAAIFLALFLLLPAPSLCANPALKTFVVSWNLACDKLNAPPKFRLEGERAISAKALLQALGQWCAIFSQKTDHDCEQDIAALADEMNSSSFLAYAKFRAAHWRGTPLKLSPQMNSQELAQALNAYLGITANGRHPDYVSRETVETVLFMNSFCAFFESRMAKLHRQGIDLGINSCAKLSTKGKYPCLDSWLEK